MPYCTLCGYYFKGRGTRCVFHDPNPITVDTQSRYTSSNITTAYPLNEPQGIVRYKPKTRGQSSRKAPTYTDYEPYRDLIHLPSSSTDPSTLPELNPSTLDELQSLASSPLYSNVSLTVAAASNSHSTPSYTLSLAPNLHREQCSRCKEWFPDQKRRERHAWEYPSGCDVHEMCFGIDEEYYHGVQYRHDRCFVRECKSVYRREGGWKKEVVKDHVADWHSI